GANDPASTRHTKVDPASFDAKAKLGVGLRVKLPSLGPESTLATGGLVSAVKPLKVEKAGFAVRSCLSSPALPQKPHRCAKVELAAGSRHRNQNRRCTFHAFRLARIVLKEPSRSRS